MLILYIVRNLPSLSRRHFLLCWSSAPEAADEVPRDQDVLGPVEEPSCSQGRLGSGQHCRPSTCLCWHHQSNAAEAPTQQQDPVVSV